MCGICGMAFKNNDVNIKKIEYFFKALLMYTESRGSDATGYFLFDRNINSVFYDKIDEPASIFVDSIAINDTNPGYIVGHTRLSTTGDPRDNCNNHPIIYGSTIGVHNGVISTHSYNSILKKYNLVPKATVDSEAGIMLINKFGHSNPELLKHLDQLSGVFCYTNIEDPEELHIAFSARELVIGYNKDKTILIFASTKDIIESAVNFIEYKGYTEFFKEFIPEDYYTLENNSRIIIKNGAVIQEDKFYYTSTYNTTHNKTSNYTAPRQYGHFKIGDFVFMKNSRSKSMDDACGTIIDFTKKKAKIETASNKIVHTKIKNLVRCEDYNENNTQDEDYDDFADNNIDNENEHNYKDEEVDSDTEEKEDDGGNSGASYTYYDKNVYEDMYYETKHNMFLNNGNSCTIMTY